MEREKDNSVENIDDQLPEESFLRKLTGTTQRLVTFVAIAMSLFQLYTATFGVLLSIRQRAIHVGFALILVWFSYAAKKTLKSSKVPIYDWIFVALSVVSFSYLAFTANEIAERMSYVTPLSNTQMIMGTIALLLLVEASRRTIGKAFVAIILVCFLYVFIGPYLPQSIAHKGFSWMWMLDQLVYTTNGIFGESAGVSATYIFVFILFGAFLDKTGAGARLIDLAFSLVGGYRGGPAKTAIMASGFFGMISGSAVANVVTTGTFTIPMMKKIGYKSTYAAAVESVSSSGGQIMPPLMGATAFLIAEFLGIPYLHIAAAAFIPAVMYFLAELLQVHFQALKKGIKGIPKEELPRVRKAFMDSFPYLVSVGVIVILLAFGFTPLKAGIYSIGFIVAVNLLMAWIKKTPPISIKEVFSALDIGARTAVQVAVICSAAGIVVGVITMTGIGLRISSVILDLAGGSLFLTLLITMVTSIILGMGLPTVGAYIIQVALTIPALVELGVPPLAAHLFIFYFGALSAITPPVAVAAYAAAGLAGCDPMKTGFTAFRLAIAGFVVPFMFVYGPSLILIGSPVEILRDTVFALIGIVALAASLEGWMFTHTHWIERILLFSSACLLIKPGLITDGIGFVLLAVALVIQWIKSRKNPAVNLSNNL